MVISADDRRNAVVCATCSSLFARALDEFVDELINLSTKSVSDETRKKEIERQSTIANIADICRSAALIRHLSTN
jgi:hypothetical protein